MKYMKQFLIIIIISFVGEIIHAVVPLPIPASRDGILILFACLKSGLIPLSAIKETGKFLIEIMPIILVPGCVGLMESIGLLGNKLIAFFVISIITTVIVMIVAGWTAQGMIRIRQKRSKRLDS